MLQWGSLPSQGSCILHQPRINPGLPRPRVDSLRAEPGSPSGWSDLSLLHMNLPTPVGLGSPEYCRQILYQLERWRLEDLPTTVPLPLLCPTLGHPTSVVPLTDMLHEHCSHTHSCILSLVLKQTHMYPQTHTWIIPRPSKHPHRLYTHTLHAHLDVCVCGHLKHIHTAIYTQPSNKHTPANTDKPCVPSLKGT